MIKIFSKLEYHPRYRDVVIFDVRSNGQEFIASPLVFVEVHPGLIIEKPTIEARQGNEFLQAVLDHAWEVGMRPRGFSDVPLQVEALKRHLADMRALAFLGKLPALVPPSLEDFETPPGLNRDE